MVKPSNYYTSLLDPNSQPTRLSNFTTEKKVEAKKEKIAAPNSSDEDTFEIVGQELNFQSLLGGNARKKV